MAAQVLYRLHDSSGRLLYVGITLRLAMRLGEHRKLKPWWPDVDQISVQHFSSRAEVEAAEREAIRREKPLHNVRDQVQAGPPALRARGHGKGTTNTPFRIPPDVKQPAVERAEADGFKTFSAAVLALLREYGAGRIDIQPDPPAKD